MSRKSLPQQNARFFQTARLRQLAPLLAFGCFTLPLTSAYAGGPSALPPVVVHPMPIIGTPVLHSTVNANVSNSGTSGSSSPQTSTKNNVNNSSNNQTGHGSSNISIQHISKLNQSVSNVPIAGQGNSNQASLQTTATKTSTLPSGGYQLDLSSTNANIVLGSNLFAGAASVTIKVGGTNVTFVPGQKVTAAEYVAIEQQLSSNPQSLVLNAQGGADGGKFNLNSALNSKVTELVVPSGVTGLDLVCKHNTLAVSGDLLNNGSIYGVSSNGGISSATISATEIVNKTGGIISTVLPVSLSSSLAVGSTSTSLMLNASDNIINSGTISSAGSLTLSSAHGLITNQSCGLITAASDVNLNLGCGSLTNSGLIASTNGQINISNGSPTTAITINAKGGTFDAPSSTINIEASGSKSNITVLGGNFLSSQVNLQAGSGDVKFSPNQVTGVVNVSANAADINPSSGNLQLGNINVSGDPNFSSVGDITIDGTISPTNGADLAIIAGGNIVSASGGVLDTSSTTGNGGNLTLVAGANFTGTAPGAIAVSDSTNPGLGSATGGLIDLTGGSGGTGPITTITTSSSVEGDNSGSIDMIAYAGTGANSGTIKLPANITVNVNGTNSANPGAVLLIAGATSGHSITTGNISAFDVTLETFTPHVSSAITFTNGTPSGGNFVTSGNAQTATLSSGNITTAGGNVSITTGGSLILSNSITGLDVSITTGGALTLGGSISAINGFLVQPNVSITAGGVLTTTSAAKIASNANGNLDLIGTSVNLSGSLSATYLQISGTSSSPSYIGPSGSFALLTTTYLTVNTGGALTMNSTGLTLSPGQGAFVTAGGTLQVLGSMTTAGNTISLTSGNTLYISGSVTTTAGGNVSLSSSSSQPFIVGSNTVNSISGVLSGSSVSVTNLQGAVENLASLIPPVALTLQGSSIIIGSALSSGDLTLTATNGNIGYLSTPITIGGGKTVNLTASRAVGGGNAPIQLYSQLVNGSAGSFFNAINYAPSTYVSITAGEGITANYTQVGQLGISGLTGDNAKITLTADPSAPYFGGTINLGPYGNQGGVINITGSSGTLSLVANGTLPLGEPYNYGLITEYSGFNSVSATNLIIAGSIGTYPNPPAAFNANAYTLQLYTGGRAVNFYDAASRVVLSAANSTTSLVFSTPGSLSVTTYGLTATPVIALYSNGTLSLYSSIGNMGSTVVLQGGIVQEPTGSTVTAGNLSILNSYAYLDINTPYLAVGNCGTVNLGNLYGGSLVVGNSSANSFSLGANGSIYLNNLSASSGYINVLSGGSLLQINGGATIEATNGSINLQNANTAAGSIVVGGGALIETSGSGNALPVNITIGPVPSRPIAGPSPSNVSFQFDGGTPYFGANGISVPQPTVTLGLRGSNIVFNTGSLLSTAITVGANTLIIADPVWDTSRSVISVPASPSTTPAILNSGSSLRSNTSVSASLFEPNLPGAANPYSMSPLLGGAQSSVPENMTLGEKSNIATILNAQLDVPVSFPLSGSSETNSPTLIANTGQSAVINGQNLASMLLAPISRIDGHFSSAQWISDTELSTGKVPAILFSDEELGINPEVSTVVELEEKDQEDLATASGTLKLGAPLLGSISRNTNGVRVMNLRRGSVVFAPSYDTVVHTSFGEVKIDARSVVLIMVFRHGLSIFDLHDSHVKAVVVKAGNYELVLSPGMHALITSESVDKFERVNPAQLIAHRNMRERGLGQGLKAFVSEFPVMQAMNAVTPLRQLVSSRYEPAQRIADHLLKTVAIIQQLCPGHSCPSSARQQNSIGRE